MIPLEQREEILQQLHIGHFGIEKTKQRARDAVYWPRLNTDIESLIARCSICQEHQWAPQKEPMVNRPIPTRPFQMVAVDLFECDGKHYLSLQDYYSRYIEVERLYSTRASFIITKMKGTGIFRQWAAVLMRGICTICKYVGIRQIDIQYPIPTVEWIGREGSADCEEDRNEGIGSRPLHRSTGVPYDAYFGLRKVTCTAVDE